ncbi:hypothetical protein V1508DRAFT_440731 [Lipomyces doorenjongii]|uniref:uncharacterized protein n=1 Tax=Lipomyces doorenjongii TaxID=383834 RepID=UPI0034CFD19E
MGGSSLFSFRRGPHRHSSLRSKMSSVFNSRSVRKNMTPLTFKALQQIPKVVAEDHVRSYLSSCPLLESAYDISTTSSSSATALGRFFEDVWRTQDNMEEYSDMIHDIQLLSLVKKKADENNLSYSDIELMLRFIRVLKKDYQLSRWSDESLVTFAAEEVSIRRYHAVELVTANESDKHGSMGYTRICHKHKLIDCKCSHIKDLVVVARHEEPENVIKEGTSSMKVIKHLRSKILGSKASSPVTPTSIRISLPRTTVSSPKGQTVQSETVRVQCIDAR